MDMSGMEMGGMDMGSSGLFQGTNMAIAWKYWAIVAVIVGVLAMVRLINVSRYFWRYVRRL